MPAHVTPAMREAAPDLCRQIDELREERKRTVERRCYLDSVGVRMRLCAFVLGVLYFVLCFRDDLNAFVCVCVRFRGFHIKFDAFRYVRHAFSVFWLISALNLMRFCAFLYFFIVFAMF